MVDFVIRFKDLALECYDEQDEGSLVEICINNIILDYMVYLENLNITQFTNLIEAARKTSISVKTLARVWRFEKKPPHQALTLSEKNRKTYGGFK